MDIIKILFIDDNSLDTYIEKLSKILGKAGMQLEAVVLDISRREFHKANESGDLVLDEELIKAHINDNYINQNFDYVACDFDFSDRNYNGYKLLKWLINTANQRPKNKIRKAKYFFYSSDTHDAEGVARSDVLGLMRLKLEKLIDRTNLPGELASSIQKSRAELNLESEFLSILDQYSDMEFKSTFPEFRGKKLSDIYNEIDSETDKGIRYQKALIEQTISNMIKMQEE